MKRGFFFIGHRGTRTDLDENTIAAFNKAIKSGANYLEFDVRRTKDGKIVILHDKFLNRTTTGSGLLKNYDYEVVKKIRTRNNFLKIPLLTDVLLELKGKVKFMIDLKESGLENDVLKLIKEHSSLGNSIFSGRYLQELKTIKNNYPGTTTCYNITNAIDFTLENFMNLSIQNKFNFKPDLISLKSTFITERFIDFCKKTKIIPLSWGFIQFKDSLSWIKILIKMGIEGILFDNHKNISIIKSWMTSS